MCESLCELIELLHTTEERTTRYRAIAQLGQIGTGREDAIDALTEIVRFTPDEPTRWLAIENLSQIAIGHSTAVETLIDLLAIGRPPTKELVAKYLPPMLGDNSSAVTALANIPRTESDEITLRALAAILGQVSTNKSAAIDALIHLVYKTSDSHTWMRSLNSLTQLKANTNDAILVYLYLIRNKSVQTLAISALKKSVLESEVIEASSQLLRCSSILAMGGFHLCKCLLSLILASMKLPETVLIQNLPIFYNSFQRLDRLMSRLSNSQMKILQKKLREAKPENFLERYLIASELGEVGLATSETLDIVLKSLQQEQHRAFRTLGYYSLAKMTASNLAIADMLTEFLSTAKDEDERQSLTWALKEAEKVKIDRLGLPRDLTYYL